MKQARFILGLLIAGLAAGCFEKSNSNIGAASTILYRHHFPGSAQLAHNTNAGRFSAILALPATRVLKEEVMQKLARSPEELWRKFLPAGAITPPGLSRPLLDDLVSAESFAEMHGPLQRSESVFAIELNDERAGVWRTNLSNILTAWNLGKPAVVTLGDATGWEIKKAEDPKLIQFVRAGKWVVIGLGQERLTLLPGLLEEIKKHGRPVVAAPPGVLLELEGDMPRLKDWLPGLTRYHLPSVHLTLKGRGDQVRTEVRLVYSEPLPLTLEPWKFPTNRIKDPVISFTVARGVAPLLSQVKGISKLNLNPVPNQFCAWGPGTIHADTYYSVPAANPSNVLYQIGPNLPEFTSNLLAQSIGGFSLISNRNELHWNGLPALFPQVRPIREGDTDFLLAELFPFSRQTNTPPPELFGQLKDKPDLAYYDWEFTQARLVHAEQMQQIWDMVNGWRFPSTNAPTQKWLAAIEPHLANTITEASLTSPKEITIVRKSDLGFTGFELAALTRWVDSQGFPWTFDPPRPMAGKPRSPGSRTNAAPSKFPGPAPK